MLKGSFLLAKVAEMKAHTNNYTMNEIVVQCGYGRENKVPNYTAFYQAMLKAKSYNEAMKIRDNERNNYSNMRQHAVTDAVFNDENYKKNLDEVRIQIHQNQFSHARITEYYFAGEMLLELVRCDGPVYIILHLPTKKCKTNKGRINSILRRGLGYSLYQKKGEWYISRPLMEDIPYTEGLRIEYPEI